MNAWRDVDVRCRSVRIVRAAMLILLTALAASYSYSATQELAQSPPKAARFASAPEPIYASGSNDLWNRIFYFLFSHRIETRLSDLFPEGAPFVDGISTRLFERDEIGDRAIDPLYPSNTGSRLVLTDPASANFRKALQEALDENEERSVIGLVGCLASWSFYGPVIAITFFRTPNFRGEMRFYLSFRH